MPANLLVIDDDTAVTDLLSTLLRSQGYEVRTANNGAEGVSLARANEPGLVILDLMMPEMDGWAVCKEIRSFSNTPILILSALNSPSMIAGILDSGADDFLTKPTLGAVLVAHIRRLMMRSAAGIPPTPSGGNERSAGKTRPLAP